MYVFCFKGNKEQILEFFKDNQDKGSRFFPMLYEPKPRCVKILFLSIQDKNRGI